MHFDTLSHSQQSTYQHINKSMTASAEVDFSHRASLKPITHTYAYKCSGVPNKASDVLQETVQLV